MSKFEIGLYSLGDYLPDPASGELISEKKRIEEIISAAKLADSLGLDVFALGESHQEHFISQAHAVILGGIARETDKIKISSAATIVSTSDPVRIFENFSTIDLMSNGRAEIVAGRASRLGLFDLLGYDVCDYEDLFEEKFELLLNINDNYKNKITWNGRFRHSLNEARIFPNPLQKKLPIWRAVGGPASSAILAGRQGVPLMIANLGGPASIFKKSIDAYKKNFIESGHDLNDMKVGVTSFFHVAETDEEALNNFYKYVNNIAYNANGVEADKYSYSRALDVRNTMLVGTPERIIDKILYQYNLNHHDRILLQLDPGGIPWNQVQYNIEILANKIAPVVREKIKSL